MAEGIKAECGAPPRLCWHNGDSRSRPSTLSHAERPLVLEFSNPEPSSHFAWWLKCESAISRLSLFELDVHARPVPLTLFHRRNEPPYRSSPFSCPNHGNPYGPLPHLSAAKEGAAVLNHNDWWRSVFEVIERSHKCFISAGPSDSRESDCSVSERTLTQTCCVAAIFLRFGGKRNQIKHKVVDYSVI